MLIPRCLGLHHLIHIVLSLLYLAGRCRTFRPPASRQIWYPNLMASFAVDVRRAVVATRSTQSPEWGEDPPALMIDTSNLEKPELPKDSSRLGRYDRRTVQQWLQFSDREMQVLIKKWPPLETKVDIDERLGLVADLTSDSVVGFFRFTLRLARSEARSVVMRHPRVLAMDREEVMGRANWLKDNAGVSLPQMAKMVKTFPTVFTYSIEGSLEPTVTWLRSSLSLNKKQMARLLVRLPQVLGLNREGSLEGTMSWLGGLGLEPEQAKKMVLSHPEIFSYSVKGRLEPKVLWLQGNLKASREEVVRMISRYPSLLGCSVKRNLGPKLSFFRDILGASTRELRLSVLSCPSLLGYSLEHRVRPRVTAMLEFSLVPQFAEHKWLLTVHADAVFKGWLAQQQGDGLSRLGSGLPPFSAEGKLPLSDGKVMGTPLLEGGDGDDEGQEGEGEKGEGEGGGEGLDSREA